MASTLTEEFAAKKGELFTEKAPEPQELVATMTSEPKDHMSVSGFATEIVHFMESIEDLEGDGDKMRETLMKQIEDQIQKARDRGDLQPGEKTIIQLGVRDPEDGEHTVFLQGEVSLDENGQAYFNEATFINQIVDDMEFSEKGRNALVGFAQGIMENWDKTYAAEENNDFVAGMTGYTTSVEVFKPM